MHPISNLCVAAIAERALSNKASGANGMLLHALSRLLFQEGDSVCLEFVQYCNRLYTKGSNKISGCSCFEGTFVPVSGLWHTLLSTMK